MGGVFVGMGGGGNAVVDIVVTEKLLVGISR